MRVAVAVALAALFVLALAAPAGAARPVPPAAKIAFSQQSEARMLARGGMRVALRMSKPGKLRVFGRLRALGTRKQYTLASTRTIRFRRAGRKVVFLKLTPQAKIVLARLVKSCKRARVAVHTRARKNSRRYRDALPPRATCSKRPTAPAGPGAGGSAPGTQGPGAPGGASGPPLKAGAASSDITPPVGTPMFAYTARSRVADPPTDFEEGLQIIADPNPDENLYAKSFEPSDGIHTRVRSRALVFERPTGERLAMVQVDLGGVPYALVQEVLERIGDTGVTGERLMISATHTHASTGPIWPDSLGYSALGGDAFDPRIFELTAEGIAESIRAAAGRLEPARVGVGTAELRNASRNRNFDPFKRNEDVPDDEAAARAASIDPEVVTVRVDAPDGRPIGLWSNFALHQTSFGEDNLLFSGDNAATAVRLADDEIAKDAAARGVSPDPGRPAVTVWSNSAEGDISPNGGPDNPDGEPLQWVPTPAAGANMAGERVGNGLVAAWRDAGARMADTLPIDARRTFVAFDGTEAEGEPVGPLAVLGQGGIVADDGTCAPRDDVAGPGQGRKAPALGGLGTDPIGLVPGTTPISLWRIGALGIVTAPSEVTKQMGVRIRERINGADGGALSKVVLAGLTNGYNSYIATPEEYDACHYEGSFTLFGRRQGPRFGDAAVPLVAPLLGGTAAPPGAGEPVNGAEGTPNAAPVDPTPDAGAATAQPALTVARHGRATFSWKGGDPAVDAPRGQTFVALQRLEGDTWRTVGTEDGPSDTTQWDDRDEAKTWTETWQFGTCDPPGRYRFHVTGRASRATGAPPEPYQVTSRAFDLTPIASLQLIDWTVSGGSARVRVRYPDPGASLLALPRRVRSGSAMLRITPPGGAPGTVRAEPDAGRLAFTAPAADGSAVELESVEDSCGNTGP